MARDYSKIAPTFWTGATGRSVIAAGPTTALVALYLVTCPHAESTGLYRLPMAYAAVDTNLTAAQLTEALGLLVELGFIELEGDLVWVVEMGRWQIGDKLAAGDKRRRMVEKRLAPHKKTSLYVRFITHYADMWGLTPDPSDAPSMPLDKASKGHRRGIDAPSMVKKVGQNAPKPRGIDGASMGHRCQEQEQEQEQEQKATVLHEHTSAMLPASRANIAPSASCITVEVEAVATPHDAPSEPALGPGPEPPPAEFDPPPSKPGAFSRLLGRHLGNRAELEPGAGRSVKLIADPSAPGGKRAGLLFGASGRVTTGPWQMSAEVYTAVEDRLFSPVPTMALPAPPHLPSAVDGEDPDEPLCDAMLTAWRAVYRHHTGKAYTGKAGKRQASIAAAARLLRGDGISAWAWFAWAWDHEVDRTRIAPGLYAVAAPAAVGRLLQRYHRDSPSFVGIIPKLQARDELLQRRQTAELALRHARPGTAAEALAVLDQHLTAEQHSSMVDRATIELGALQTKTEIAITRGFWIWQ